MNGQVGERPSIGNPKYPIKPALPATDYYAIFRRLDLMRNLKLTVAYDGTDYYGWQFQPGVPTVQGRLEEILGRILNQPIRVHGSGRTDAGVHAHGQIANFTAEMTMDLDALDRGVNALLPPDIRVLSVEEVRLEFHARKSAKSKRYEYHVWTSPVVSPFHTRYVHPVGHQLDVEAVDFATALFVGRHDFTSFSATSTRAEDRVRNVLEARWDRGPDEWVFRIQADGFLQYMVRTIVGTLIEVGRGRIAAGDISSIFEAADRAAAGPSAPAKGLHMVSVVY